MAHYKLSKYPACTRSAVSKVLRLLSRVPEQFYDARTVRKFCLLDEASMFRVLVIVRELHLANFQKYNGRYYYWKK